MGDCCNCDGSGFVDDERCGICNASGHRDGRPAFLWAKARMCAADPDPYDKQFGAGMMEVLRTLKIEEPGQ